jgi:CRISPR/Cas system CMR-associated protein Cmr5 small subunit
MAMQQIIETQQSSMDYYSKYQQLFISLSNGLEDWIAHILSSKVKQGKAKPKAANKEVDSTPANYIQNIMNKNKESNIMKSRRKKNLHSIIIITTKKFSILEIL